MRAAIAVLLVFVILTLGLTWPLALHAADAVEDRQDALLNTWILAFEGQQLLRDPLRLFDANIFYPYPRTLAFSESILPNALVALPLSLATDNPVVGYNVSLLMTFVLSGFAMYLLALKTTGSRWGGLAAGVLYAFNAYRMSNIAQVQLLALQWLPLALLYVWRVAFADGGAMERLTGARPMISSPADAGRASTGRPLGSGLGRCAFLLALFFVLQALSSFYYAILTALAAAIWVVVAVAVAGKRPSSRAVATALVALGAAVLAVSLFSLPYWQVEGELGFRRSVAESEPFSASLAQYVQAAAGSLVYSRLAPAQPVVIGGYPLDALFPGVVALLLAGLGLVGWRRRWRTWLAPMVLGLVSFVLSLGPRLALAPGVFVDCPLTMPYRLLYAVPAMQALRAPVRFAALVFLAMSILVGLGVAVLERRASGPARWRPGARAACLVGVVGLALETVTLPAVHVAHVPTGASVPAVYGWLAQQEGEVVLELPMIAQTPGRGLLNQYFSIYHWRTTPDGYSGFIPPKHGEVVYEMQFFPSERSVSLLEGMDVRHLVVHTGLLEDWAERYQRLGAFSSRVTEVQRFDETLVFRIRSPATSEPPRLGLYLPPRARTGDAYVVSLIVYNRAQRSAVLKPTIQAEVEAVWMMGENVVSRQHRTAGVPIVTSEASVVTFALDGPRQAGSYRLQVVARIAGWGEVRDVHQVAISESAPPVGQVVPARLVAGWSEKETYQPGEPVHVNVRWRALGKIDAYYSVFARLLDANGQAIAQKDDQPASGRRPTLLWVPGEEIEDGYVLAIPPTAPAGVYTLDVGIYRAADLSPRLTLDEAGYPVERLVLGTVRVLGPP